MLDLGFMPDVQKVSRHPSMPSKTSSSSAAAAATRQTLMFSATFPEEVCTYCRISVMLPDTLNVTRNITLHRGLNTDTVIPDTTVSYKCCVTFVISVLRYLSH